MAAAISHLVIVLSYIGICLTIGIGKLDQNGTYVMDMVENTTSSQAGQILTTNSVQVNDSVETSQNLSSNENVTGFNFGMIQNNDSFDNYSATTVPPEDQDVFNVNNTENLEQSSVVQIIPVLVNDTQTNVVEFELPNLWADFCELGEETYTSDFTDSVNLTVIRCNVTVQYSDILNLKVLREHGSRYKEMDLKYSVEIICSDWSNISISWPMKVENLYSLKVRHCQILDFLADFRDPLTQSTADSLRVLDLSDNKVLLSTDMYLNITRHVSDILPEYNCGHDNTIERMSMRNITYSFIGDVNIMINKLTELGEQFILDAKRLPVKCIYKHLTYLDEGQSSSMSIYHTELKDSIFDQLKIYNLSYSYIKVLKDNQLQWSINFPKLEMYDLSHNHISKLYRFEVPLHSRTDQLTTINLQHNRINTVSVDDLERLRKMPTMFVDIRNNPIDCNCTHPMRQLMKYIKEKKYLEISNLTDYSYLKDLQCVQPARLRSKTLQSVADLSILCENNIETEYFLTPILILSATIVVLCIMLFTILRYRQEVMIILFTRFNIIIPCHQRDCDDSTKLYDAFVSYSSREEEWVENLFEELENQPAENRRFRFCLHHRDFIPGKTIFDNVIRSVESSRHTIILLSNNFLKSEYCLYEFQEAFRQSIMEQKRHLVIVMVEELEADRLPRDLRRCIQTFTYIKKDDYLFRERLIYALSVKQKTHVVNTEPGSKSKHKTPTNKTTTFHKQPSKEDKTNNRNNAQDNITNNSVDSSVNKQSTYVDILTPNDLNLADSNPKPITNCNSASNITTPNCNSDSNIIANQTNELNVTRGSTNEKVLALNIIDNKFKNDSNGEVFDGCNMCVDSKLVGYTVPVEGHMGSFRTDYDRSISSVSRDTGYDSEKGSPEVCLHHCEKFKKNIFVDVENVRNIEV